MAWNVNFCSGDLVDDCPECMSYFPPGEGVAQLCAQLMDLTLEQRDYMISLMNRISVKFQC